MTDDLPPLPSIAGTITSDDMRAYALAAIAPYRAEIERLKRDDVYVAMKRTTDDLRERAEKSEAENAKLRELLRPLADLDQSHNRGIRADVPLFAINGKAITAGDVRAASAALGQP